MEQTKQNWKQCLEVIKSNISDQEYKTWFAPIVLSSYTNKTLVLEVPSLFFAEILESRYIDLLSKVICRFFAPDTQLEYKAMVVKSPDATTTIPGEHNRVQTRNNAVSSPAKNRLPAFDSQLNPAYSFDTLVEGNSNKLARTAGLSIAKEPGKTAFNPLFIYGQSGVGKTHLANAIGVMTKQLNPDARVLYVPANTFLIQYTDAVRNNDQNNFLNFYQTIDVLIVDDIQEFAGKQATQNTFFHIFNHLHQAGKQLVLTSDRPPLALAGLEQRLLTRFKWGLSAELERPDLALRKAILKSKIYRNGLEIPEDVVDFIATNIDDNVRDLEGVLISIMAHSTLTNAPINLDLAKKIMGNVVNLVAKQITVESIRDVVCEHFALPVAAISTNSRKREVVQARQIAMYFSKQLTSNSLSSIGSIIGQRDHATVLHACKVVAGLIEMDKNFKATMEEIEEKIKS